MQIDVVSLGELLIDFFDIRKNPQENFLFEVSPGGAPANVLAILSNLGKITAFIGCVGDDFFGESLKKTLDGCGINTDALQKNSAPTTLAFVQNDEHGERTFSFFRNKSADTQLRLSEIPLSLLKNTRIFHFGTLSMSQEPAAHATQESAIISKKAGALLSFDPNFRPKLWGNQEEMIEKASWGLRHCDILKIAQEELELFCGTIEQLCEKFPNIRLVILTKGSDGSVAFFGEHTVEVPAYSVQTIDTTGAGDCFFGCCLSHILEHGLEHMDKKSLQEMLSFASAAAALVVTRKGALQSMPQRHEIEAAQEDFYKKMEN